MTYAEVMKKYKTDKPDLRKDKNDKNEFAFCWVYDYPLFSYNKEEKKWSPEHHMFSSPTKEHIKYLEKVLPYLHQLWGRPVHIETHVENRDMLFTYDGRSVQRKYL